MTVQRKFSLLLLVCILFAGCNKRNITKIHDGRLFRCSYPSSWDLTLGDSDTPYESIEFDLGEGRLIFLTAYRPENTTTLEQYCTIVTTGFPKKHHELNPDHKVTTEFKAKPVSIGPHKGLSTRFLIDTPDVDTACVYRFFRIPSDDYLIFVEVFEEAHLGSIPEDEVARLLSSIAPSKKKKVRNSGSSP